MLTHRWNLLNLGQNLHIKRCEHVICYGRCNLEIQYIYIFEKLKKFNLKKKRSNFDFLKFHNHLVNVSKCIYFPLEFIISFINTYLITINHLEWNSIWFKNLLTINLVDQSVFLNFKSPLLTIDVSFSKNSCTNVFIIKLLI
jgi:hypothetical protein